ncbi:MAG: acyl-CoA thioesterase [Desulfotalea sp.]
MITHCYDYRVRYGDTDAAGVVYNANYLRLFEIGRSEMMREHGCSYKSIEDEGILLPVTEAYSRFKGPAKYDDLIVIETSITELKKLTCKFSYRITRDDGGSSRKLLAKGYTVHAAVTKEGKLTRLPEKVIMQIERLIDKDE